MNNEFVLKTNENETEICIFHEHGEVPCNIITKDTKTH
jgi:hypothetical protein